MAKVHKANSEDDGQNYDGGDVDAKSGKAKVNLDTKAEKMAAEEKVTSNDGSKSGKLAKTSSKSGKSLKVGNAHKLFAKTVKELSMSM